MVQFARLEYLPTFIFRWSEIIGIENLSEEEKQLLFPLFRIRPWANSKSLANSFDRINQAMSGNPFACDVDDWYDKERSNTGAAQELRNILQDPSYSQWYEFVRQFDNAIPCLRLDTEIENIEDALRQEWLEARGFGIVLNEYNLRYLRNALACLPNIHHNNFFVAVDMGWSRDPLQQAQQATSICVDLLRAKPDVTIFLSSSSFPVSFDNFGFGEAVNCAEYALYDEVRRQLQAVNNEYFVKYADWGTTRPPSDGGGGWIPRIDLPRGRNIRLYRRRIADDETKDEVCSAIAAEVTASDEWVTPPPSWGHYQIETTAAGGQQGIYHARKNSATRINMYLHQKLSEIILLKRQKNILRNLN